ncbi:MAG: DNA-processing protein DprA [Puniceicoccaceae bacterium]
MAYDRRTSLMILAALPGIGPVNLRKLDRALEGGAEQLLEMDHVKLANWCPPRVVEQLSNWQRYFPPDRVFRELKDLAADFVTSEEPDYPERLRPFSDRPIGLYRSRAGLNLTRRNIAIVGTRKPSAYGRRLARIFSSELCRQGICIVSGLAEGIDTEAHRAALECGGKTAAILGSGLNCVYPSSNRGLMESIRESGGVWTEFPLWRRADRRSFPQRNRIVAGVSEAVVVIESGSRGGSLITARMASEQGRPVYVLPGRVDSPESAGCHALIRDGAQLVTRVEDILDDLEYLPKALRPQQSRGTQAPADKDPELEGLQAGIWQFLAENGPSNLDDVASGTDSAIPVLSGTVLEMEVAGLLCRRLDGRYERA